MSATDHYDVKVAVHIESVTEGGGWRRKEERLEEERLEEERLEEERLEEGRLEVKRGWR
jgi:hypothetical protein